MTTQQDATISPERRRFVRYRVDLPASLRITTYTSTAAFQITDARIQDVCKSGLGLVMTLAAESTHQDLSKLLVRRRTCHIFTHFPGSDRKSHLVGTIVGVDPRRTSRGLVVRFGVTLEHTDPDEMARLREFVEAQAEGA